jgi:dynein heavy chain 1
MVAWFNSVIQERLRYTPLGWSKMYEFNESDLKSALDTLDSWIDLSPNNIQWNAIRTLLASCIYGARIDNDFDQNLLTTFVNKFFSNQCFDEKFLLVDDKQDRIYSKEFTNKDSYLNWINEIDNEQKPSWLGLPNNAEGILLTNIGLFIGLFWSFKTAFLLLMH